MTGAFSGRPATDSFRQPSREGGVAAFMDWWETLPLFATQQELPPATRAAIRIGREAQGAETKEGAPASCATALENTSGFSR